VIIERPGPAGGRARIGVQGDSADPFCWLEPPASIRGSSGRLAPSWGRIEHAGHRELRWALRPAQLKISASKKNVKYFFRFAKKIENRCSNDNIRKAHAYAGRQSSFLWDLADIFAGTLRLHGFQVCTLWAGWLLETRTDIRDFRHEALACTKTNRDVGVFYGATHLGSFCLKLGEHLLAQLFAV
jgi:hypothetical protein